MYLKRRFLQIISITTTIVQCRAEDGKQPVLGLSGSRFPQRSSKGLNVVQKKEQDTSLSHIRKRTLEVATTRLFDVATKAFGVDDDCCSDNGSGDDLSPTSTPSTNPTLNPTFSEKKFFASDGSDYDYFGSSCSISDDLVVIGAPNNERKGAAYVLDLDGTEVMKLTPGDDGETYDSFGYSVSMDEKVVVGTGYSADYVRVFSLQGIYERTIRCDDCSEFGIDVETLGNLIVTNGEQNSIYKLFIYTKEGQLLKSYEQEYRIFDVAISEQFILSTAYDGKTFIYSNTSPDFPKIAEINQGGYALALSGDRIVIGDPWAINEDGAAYLYKTDGTLITALDRQDSTSGVEFGSSVAISDNKVLVGVPAHYVDDTAGSVIIYSAVTGEFIEKAVAPDGEASDDFGRNVCASGSYFVVGAPFADGVDNNGYGTGTAYLFQFPEE